MSEKPILFTDPMVNAIIAGNKTLTSRAKCRFEAGDVLWVKETHKYWNWTEDGEPFIKYRADDSVLMHDNRERYIDDEKLFDLWATLSEPTNYAIDNAARDQKWRPSRFMPRWMSRITLEVTEVFKYHLQDMTDEMAISEGAIYNAPCFEFKGVDAAYGASPKHAYIRLLESMRIIENAHANPELFGVRFKVLEIKK
jgi:hypothetical protein